MNNWLYIRNEKYIYSNLKTAYHSECLKITQFFFSIPPHSEICNIFTNAKTMDKEHKYTQLGFHFICTIL